eukprot:scaffold117595_cov69-Phaeocystis_antarctica.AAC.1
MRRVGRGERRDAVQHHTGGERHALARTARAAQLRVRGGQARGAVLHEVGGVGGTLRGRIRLLRVVATQQARLARAHRADAHVDFDTALVASQRLEDAFARLAEARRVDAAASARHCGRMGSALVIAALAAAVGALREPAPHAARAVVVALLERLEHAVAAAARPAVCRLAGNAVVERGKGAVGHKAAPCHSAVAVDEGADWPAGLTFADWAGSRVDLQVDIDVARPSHYAGPARAVRGSVGAEARRGQLLAAARAAFAAAARCAGGQTTPWRRARRRRAARGAVTARVTLLAQFEVDDAVATALHALARAQPELVIAERLRAAPAALHLTEPTAAVAVVRVAIVACFPAVDGAVAAGGRRGDEARASITELVIEFGTDERTHVAVVVELLFVAVGHLRARVRVGGERGSVQ